MLSRRIMELGFGEIVVIAAIVLLLFGPKKLPQLGEALGRGIRNFKDGMTGKDDEASGEAPAQQALPPASRTSEPAAPAQPTPGATSVNGVPAHDGPR
jgi:sec-independent protein translocase protein TatA